MSIIPKTWQYKILNPQGVYMGMLKGVTSPFGYNQPIGTAGTQTLITVAQSADNINTVPSQILDENGIGITDENSNPITEDRQPDILGSGNSTSLIQNDNLIVVFEYSQYHPNGIIVFQGYISKWKATFGSTDDILVTCLSNGQDLSNRILPVGDGLVVDQSQLALGLDSPYNTFQNNGGYLAQTFVVGAGVTNLAGVTLWLGLNIGFTTQDVGVKIIAGSPSGGTIEYGSVLVSADVTITNSTPEAIQFIFPAAMIVLPGQTYTIVVEYADGSAGIAIGFHDVTVTYTAGLGWQIEPYPGGFNSQNWFPIGNNGVLYFETLTSAFTTDRTFTNEDVSTILTTGMSEYRSGGGQIAPDTYVATGIVTTYTFKLSTMLNFIQTLLSLGPANYYWYGDPATNKLIYKVANTVADIVFIKGRHINELDIEATRESIKNIAYFSGGDDGTGSGTNIFVQVNNADSLLVNRVGLALLSDNRVAGTGGTAVGKLISQNYLDDNDAETYITNITIQDGTMDTSLIKLGMMAGFAGFGTFVEQLLLQVVGINKQADQVVLQLGTLPIRSSQAVEQIQRQLIDVQTVANPNSPS